MIARLWIRYALLGLVALGIIGIARPAAAANPSQASILIAKQLVELKDVTGMFAPLVRGVVEKVKNQFMQTNFMWGKDLNEIAANLERDYAPRVDELVDATARTYAEHFSEVELKEMLVFY